MLGTGGRGGHARGSGARWSVLVLGLLLTGCGMAWVFSTPGVYLCRAHVVLLAPPTQTRPNKLDSNSAGLLATAGVLERELSVGRNQVPATSPDVTLLDQGVYDGELVRMPNYGGQWAADFRDPVLDLQATAATSDEALDRVEAMVAEATDLLRQKQDAAGVSTRNRIALVLSPARLRVEYHPGDRVRGGAVLLLLGVVGSVTAAAATGRRRAPLAVERAA